MKNLTVGGLKIKGTRFQKFEKFSTERWSKPTQKKTQLSSTRGLQKNFSCTREVTLLVYTVEISVSTICIKVVVD